MNTKDQNEIDIDIDIDIGIDVSQCMLDIHVRPSGLSGSLKTIPKAFDL